MAWRPYDHLIAGELDNTEPNKVTGWLEFHGVAERVTVNLEGNFHRDIRGAKIALRGNDSDQYVSEYMNGFGVEQTGNVGDITAGLPPADYTNYPYVEWYSNSNGRVVLELGPEQVTVIGRPIPACESDPISREKQEEHMDAFLKTMMGALNDDQEEFGDEIKN